MQCLLTVSSEHLKRSHTLKHGCSTCGHRFGARSDKRLELDKEEHKAKCGTSSQRGKRAKLMTPKEDEDYNALKKCDWISMYRVFNREGLIPSQCESTISTFLKTCRVHSTNCDQI